MKLDLIGCGCGPESLSLEARAALDGAELVLGAPRLLELAPEGAVCRAAKTTKEILAALLETKAEKVCVLFSGDCGFYSGARLLLPELEGWDVRLLPGLSSLQVFAARLKQPWQSWRLCSAHGVDCDTVAAVCSGRPAFFLTGGKTGPAELCRELTEAGLGFLQCSVGEDLGMPEERISCGSAETMAQKRFAPLSVLLVEPAPRTEKRTPGIPDTAFQRAEGIPMTKQEIRAVALGKLAVGPEDCCWDVGAGSGSVGIELALQTRQVWGIERDERALALAEENRRRFGAWNLRLVDGEAPDALESLPRPDAVFVGGSGGKLPEILRAIHGANPAARICVTAVTLESAAETVQTLRELGRETELCQIGVSRGRDLGERTMLLAQNPIFLITGMGV